MRTLMGQAFAIRWRCWTPWPAFTCPKCRRTTYHPQAVEHEYCPCCGNALLPKSCEHAVEP